MTSISSSTGVSELLLSSSSSSSSGIAAADSSDGAWIVYLRDNLGVQSGDMIDLFVRIVLVVGMVVLCVVLIAAALATIPCYKRAIQSVMCNRESCRKCCAKKKENEAKYTPLIK